MSVETPYLNARVRRNEDARLLTGRARFVDDVDLPGMLHVAFVRSDHAHARLVNVDVSAARQRRGVAAVYTFADLGEYGRPAPLLVPPPPIAGLVFHPCTHRPLVHDKVRYVGEPIAMVVAESRYIAEDAVRDVVVDVDPLEAVVGLEAALSPRAPRVHEHLDSNAAAHVVQRKGDYDAARASAGVVISRRFTYDRGAAAALENRSVVAAWDAQVEELTVWDTTQAPIPIRNGLAARLGLLESQVRVVAPFVGGGFGPKIMMFYPEELLVPWVSMRLARPIKWTEDRQENFYATTQERGQLHDAEMALTRDGRILGVRDTFLFDTGAYDPYGLTIPINTQCTLLGPYDIPAYHSEFTAVFTNKTIVTPVRGAGRQHGVFVSERLLDIAARELGLDRVEIRKRNLLGPDRFPHNHEIMFQDSAPLVYDSGDYLPALEQAAATIGYDELLKTAAQRRTGTRRVGVGIACYVEGTGIGPYEGARVTVEPSGKVHVATGVGTQGQGHYTVFAQLVADVLGVGVEDVQVITGDTREFQWGTGTFASRGAAVAGSACHAAATLVREKILKLAATVLAAEPADLELASGRVSVRGASPPRSISLAELAARANPLRGAVRPGTEPGLESTAYFGPDRGSTASGVHAIVVEVDMETAMVETKRYLVVHDCGRMINPLLVEGQIHGGVAHGLGNAFYEQLVYDEQGQLLNASFMDYLLPTATDVPAIETAHRETPSPFNPVGLKGVGEAGCIPTGAAFAQAVEDALGIEILEIPLSPNRLFTLMQSRPTLSGSEEEMTAK